MILQEPVKAAIWHCLENYDYADAIFLSERLYAEVNTDDSLHMLATAYYRNGQIDHAYHVLKDKHGASPQCRYLLANCAFNMERFSEAESAILDDVEENLNTGNFETLITEYGEQSPFVLFLLAKTFIKTERRSRAVDALKIALKLNPFLWSSFIELCNLGEKPNPQTVFQLSTIEDLSMCHGIVDHMKTQTSTVQENIPSITITPDHIPPELTLPRITLGSKFYTPEERLLENPFCLSGVSILPGSKIKSQLRSPILSDVMSPSFGVLPLDTPDTFFTTPLVMQNDQHKSLAKKVRAHMGNLINRKEPPLQNTTKPIFNLNTLSASTPTPGNNLQSNVRRSTRLFSSHSYSVKENNKSPNRNKFATPKSPTRKTKRIPKCNLNKTNAENVKNRLDKERSETITSLESKASAIQQNIDIQKQSAEGLMSLLRTLGQAYLNLAQFDGAGAINELNDLAPQHYTTTWVYSIIGLAYFEMADYDNSAKCFEKIRSREPYQIKFMDVYSTALWHLQKEVTLSALAQDLIQLNKLSPITWCVSGNCFSLHKEHDTAIKFFQRAVQVDPNFTYAYTLLGHEYIMTEELDKAMSCFRNAIRIDPRHYNAWFGIGTIYSKQERFHLAEINYSRALDINPRSSVIMCHIGVVQHALKKTEKALNTFDTAICNDNKNPLCKFHRGSIYFAVGRHAEALKELEELKEIVPKESLVYYLIGKVHKKLGNTDLALMHFSWATDLDPKGANSQIKEAFDPAAGRHLGDFSFEDYHSESNQSLQPQVLFGGNVDDSDESL